MTGLAMAKAPPSAKLSRYCSLAWVKPTCRKARRSPLRLYGRWRVPTLFPALFAFRLVPAAGRGPARRRCSTASYVVQCILLVDFRCCSHVFCWLCLIYTCLPVNSRVRWGLPNWSLFQRVAKQCGNNMGFLHEV